MILIDRILIVFFIFIANNVFSNDTDWLNNELKNKSVLYLESKEYLIDFNKIVVSNKSIEIIGSKNTIIRSTNSVKYSSKTAPFLISFLNCEFVCVRNIHFESAGNSAYAIKISKNKTLLKESILIENNHTSQVGLVNIIPDEGFTFNLYDETFQDWFTNGRVKYTEISSNIKISNNTCIGDPSFKGPKLDSSSASAISLHFVKNVEVSNNNIKNFKFGVWVYGGGSKTRDKLKLSTNEIICDKISVQYNNVSQTYCPIWFSKSRNIEVNNNYCEDNTDVAIDFEGCEIGNAHNNTVINSQGGALVVLNGSRKIIFNQNKVIYKNKTKKNNIILIRDGNSDITYSNNEIENNSIAKSQIMIKNSSEKIANNTNIVFEKNTFSNIEFKIKSKSKVKLVQNSNKIKNKESKLIFSLEKGSELIK